MRQPVQIGNRGELAIQAVITRSNPSKKHRIIIKINRIRTRILLRSCALADHEGPKLPPTTVAAEVICFDARPDSKLKLSCETTKILRISFVFLLKNLLFAKIREIEND